MFDSLRTCSIAFHNNAAGTFRVTTHGVQMALQSHANQGYIQIQGQKSPFPMDYAAKKNGY
jgi:hypothetical protein